MPHRPAKPVGVVPLDLTHHDRLGPAVDQAIRNNLSVLEVTGDTLWTASDETASIERLVTTDRGASYGDHRSFKLGDYFDLPEPDGEVDIEGVAAEGHWLWVTGSMSLARKKPKPGETDPKAALERLTQVKTDPNRWLLGRIPCLPAADGAHALHRSVTLADGTHLEAACLKLSAKGANPLTKALKGDEHLARFLEVPAKENGFDVEGLAVAPGKHGVARVFLGLRGPVLRGWAVVLELEIEMGKHGRLRLCGIGPDDEPYRKHFLDLDGLGIRDMKVRGDDLLLLAGPTMDLDGPVAVWRWPEGLLATDQDVVPRSRLVRVLDVPHGVGFDHAEGMCLRTLPGEDRPRLLVAYDNPGKDRMHRDGADIDLDLFDLP